jgi:hypothetical protein
MLIQLHIDASGSRESINVILSRKFGMTHILSNYLKTAENAKPTESLFSIYLYLSNLCVLCSEFRDRF